MRFLQYVDNQRTRVARVDDGGVVTPLSRFETMYELARRAIAGRQSLEQVVSGESCDAPVSYAELLRDARLLPPLTHPDPAHCLVSGTGLTHLGSAAARDSMHQKLNKQDAVLTDSMKMFKWGVEGGRPAKASEGGTPGTQPEWFYKGNGGNVVACGQPLQSPDYAEDHGEEPELVGCYVIDDQGQPRRLGFAIGNEFSDHVTERRNYLLLAHSKLRQCGVGPMLNAGTIPAHMEGTSRIRRDGAVLWQKPFLTGEGNMSHTFANLEYHHFKYRQHRAPGDVHLHFFGTATLSFVDNIKVEPGDEFEIDLPALGAPLRNGLAIESGGHAAGATIVL
jgi:hypothetical protein